ncbi:uncharacterized protein EV422DRAFT_524947 [Fimicolochytrium jonesii]|uniref:uncharacterized protein n=1 Tax=Fimicolochytrium jonesii TaxID=1396493 RepID=UPI0022FEADAE|nr:uncharacterized protein EV422DRAFT_524947 [Fimicolochytrium jonesii]KAI8822674.1 hypothetical protein EV422DRAFT_524947 [Fimicolochytrium jonesii]
METPDDPALNGHGHSHETVPLTEVVWVNPSDSHGTRWEGFLMSQHRVKPSNRHMAKCSFCHKVYKNGKPDKLCKHMKDCPEVPHEFKRQYLSKVLEESGVVKTVGDMTDASLENTPVVPVPRKRKLEDGADMSDLLKINKKSEQQALYVLLSKALITANVPLRLLSNPYFQDYQRRLARIPFHPPAQEIIGRGLLPLLNTEYEQSVMQKLGPEQNMTLSLDGFVDLSGNSTYALMLSRADVLKELVESLELSRTRHTTDGIREAVEKALQKHSLGLHQVIAFASDSSDVLLGVRSLLAQTHPYILGVTCCLHVFNRIVKDILEHECVAPIVRTNKKLAKFFLGSPFWSERLHDWRHKNGLTPAAEINSDGRWCSISKVCYKIQTYEDGFKHCWRLHVSRPSDTPSFPDKIPEILADRRHFADNHCIIALLTPILEAIRRLESRDTHLGDIWKELTKVYRELGSLTLPGLFNTIRAECMSIVSRRARVFWDDVYVIAFFLSPPYRRAATSKKIPLQDVTRMVLGVSRRWKYTFEEACRLTQQIELYHNNVAPYNFDQGLNVRTYWTALPTTAETLDLKRLAITLFQITPHATGVEHLSNIWSSKARTKHDPALNVAALRTAGLLNAHYRIHWSETRRPPLVGTSQALASIPQSIPQQQPHPTSGLFQPPPPPPPPPSSSSSQAPALQSPPDVLPSSGLDDPFGALFDADDVEEFERGVFAESDVLFPADRADTSLEQLFDLSMANVNLEEVQSKTVGVGTGMVGVGNGVEWSIDDALM